MNSQRRRRYSLPLVCLQLCTDYIYSDTSAAASVYTRVLESIISKSTTEKLDGDGSREINAYQILSIESRLAIFVKRVRERRKINFSLAVTLPVQNRARPDYFLALREARER